MQRGVIVLCMISVPPTNGNNVDQPIRKSHMAHSLDSYKISHYLEPWIKEMGSKYPFVEVPLVHDLLVQSATRNFEIESLQSQLSPFMEIDKPVRHFLKKFQSAIREFSQRSVAESRPPPQQKAQFSRTFTPQPRKPQRIESIPPPPPSAQLPSFFITGKAISLRQSDKSLRQSAFSKETKEQSNRPTPVPFDRKIPTVVKPKQYEFHFIDQEAIEKRIAEKKEEEKIDLNVANGLPIFDVIALKRSVPTPQIDWWDLPFVKSENQIPICDGNGSWIPADTVNAEYENAAPISVRRPKEKDIPLLLTTEQRKRLRQIRKLQKQREERLMIKLNLKKAEAPKLKSSNLVDISKASALMSSIDIDDMLKKQKEERIKKHEAENEANKLTAEQRSLKRVGQRKSDSEGNILTSVFSFKALYHPLHFAKLTSMAKKWNATGGIFIVSKPTMNFVVLEAGEKGTRKYSALVEHRINWKQECEGVPKEVSGSNMAATSFQGMTLKRRFFSFKKYVFDVSTQCRKFFEKYDAVDLFDSAARFG